MKDIAAKSFSQEDIERIVGFWEDRPYKILGPHKIGEGRFFAIHALLPRATRAWVRLASGKIWPMEKIHADGFYRAVFPETKLTSSYTIGFTDRSGATLESEDPYAFGPEITDYDLYLISEGNHFKSYEKFGARVRSFHGISGVHFALWAPNAKTVSVVGNFNHWRPGAHPMTRIGHSGVWGLFIPGLKEGEIYKYAIRGADSRIHLKGDPYALAAEVRPRTASVVASIDSYSWNDAAWIKERSQRDPLASPLAIYEVHLGSWKRKVEAGNGFLNYKELAHQLVDYVKELGYTHIELMPVMEHPYDKSWGYQVVNYYAPTSRFGKPEDFMYFVDHCHQNKIGVILDWVPGHFPKDAHGLACFDGREIYAYENWKKGEQRDWGTLVFDFGRNEVRNFLISNALFWLEKYHVDGLRMDAVASMLYLDYSRKPGEWEPNIFGGRENLEAVSFLKRFNEVVHAYHKGILTIAEESTAWAGVSRPTYLGGLGFSMKWNMGWMHDTLEYFCKDPVHRKFHQNMLTFSLMYAFTENFILPISHDEVVHGKGALLAKMPGDVWQKFANLRLFLALMYAHPGKKLLFMGQEFGQWDEWNSDFSMDWHLLEFEPHRQIQRLAKDLNALYKGHPAFYQLDFTNDGFEWMDFSDSEASIISFARWSFAQKQLLLFAFNLTPVPRENYVLGVPRYGFYREILNTDAPVYGGSGLGNLGGVQAEDIPSHGRPYSVRMTIPPLSGIIFRWEEPA